MKSTLYVFECKSGKHRIARKGEQNSARCSRCDPVSDLRLVGTVEQNEDESDNQHLIRALRLRKQTVH